MKIKRRQFLGGALTATTGAVVGGSVSAETAWAAAAAPPSTDPIGLVPLGKHLTVSRIGIGFGVKSSNRESNLSRRGLEHAEKVVRHAYDAGVRFFDQADLYGCHQYVARALAGKPRESYILSSKVWFHPQGIPAEDVADADVAVKRFLKECNADYLDLVQIHCMSRRDWPVEMRKQMDLLEGLKEKGLIRAHGVTCHAVAALEAAAEEPWVDVVHARINPYGIKMNKPAAETMPVVEKIHAAGKGVIGMKLLGEGEFSGDSGKCDESIRYVTSSGAVDALIVGFETTDQIDDFKGRVGRTLVAQAEAAKSGHLQTA
jgi:aryl-alcohol dehydrogenase-like predicted oxidoreductase